MLSNVNMIEEASTSEVKVLCIVHLNDATVIKVTNQEVLEMLSVLGFCASNGVGNAEDIPTLKVHQFEPAAIRYVLEKALECKKVTGKFDETSLFQEVKEMDMKVLCNVLEVANFLDCPPIVKFMPPVIGERLRTTEPDEIIKAFGVEEDINEEEMAKYTLALAEEGFAEAVCHQ